MDNGSLAPADEAYDLIARQRAAAIGQPGQQATHPGDLHANRGYLFRSHRQRQQRLVLMSVLAITLFMEMLPAINQFHRGSMRADFVAADGCQQIFECCLAKLASQPVLIFLGGYIIVTSTHHFEFALQAFASDLDIDSALVYFQIAANLAAGGRGTSETEPVAGWVSRAGGHHIPNIPTRPCAA